MIFFYFYLQYLNFRIEYFREIKAVLEYNSACKSRSYSVLSVVLREKPWGLKFCDAVPLFFKCFKFGNIFLYKTFFSCRRSEGTHGTCFESLFIANVTRKY